MQRNVSATGTQRPASPGGSALRTAAGRERDTSMRGDRRALSAISVVLVGPIQWRTAVDGILAGNPRLAVAADVEGDPREVDIYSIPQGDVILIAVESEHPNNAIEFALRLQAKDRGTGIALVLPNMSYKHLRGFHTYAGSWSLISASACGDPARLSAVLESAGRGIPWVDTAISRLLKVFEHGTVDFDEEFDDDAIRGLMQKPEPVDEGASDPMGN